jgi:hypothetical protein
MPNFPAIIFPLTTYYGKKKFRQCFPKVFELFYCGAKSGLVLGAKKQETFS